MPVTNIECQLAKGQIGRYLSGDSLSAEALRQLEAHIGDCPTCKAALFERKAVLQLMLGQETPTKAVVEMETSDETDFEMPQLRKESAAARPKRRLENPMAQALRAHAEEEKKQNRPKPIVTDEKATRLSKPLMFSCALAAVLMGMSYLSKTEMSPFGPKALAAFNKLGGSSSPSVAKPTAPPVAAKPTPSTGRSFMPTPVASNPTPSEETAPSLAVANNDAPVTPATTPTPAPAVAATTPPKEKAVVQSPAPTKAKEPVVVKTDAPPPAKPVVKAAPAKASVTASPAKNPLAVAKKPARRWSARKHHMRKGTGTIKVYR